MEVVHKIEIEMIEKIDDKEFKGVAKDEIYGKLKEYATNYTDKVIGLVDDLKKEGLVETKVIYGLAKPVSLKDVLKEIAKDLTEIAEEDK